MVSSFPKMQKSSASFSQSIRNRLRLKKLQAQAKNFCRGLDIRVSQHMKMEIFESFQFLLCRPTHNPTLQVFSSCRVQIYKYTTLKFGVPSLLVQKDVHQKTN